MKKKVSTFGALLLSCVLFMSSAFQSGAVYAQEEETLPPETAEETAEVIAEETEEVIEEVTEEAPEVTEEVQEEEPEVVEVTEEVPEEEPEIVEETEEVPAEEEPEIAEETEEVVNVVYEEEEYDPEWFLAEKCETTTFAEDLIYPGNENYSVIAGMKVEEKGAEAADGTVFTKRFSAGTGNTGSKALKVTVSELSHIIAYCQSSGDGARVLRMVNEKGETVHDFTAAGKAEKLTPSVGVNIEAGTYYLFSTGSTVVTYGLHIVKGKAPRKGWDQVADPVITGVEKLDNGNLQVSFSAEIGQDGADSGRIFMMKNGFEAAYKDVKSEDPVTFTPTANGDHSFRMIIMRAGEADKESEEYLFKDYVMPPAKPSITWLANLGEGKVYADWNNVTPDQGCNVYYKAADAGDDAYVKVEEGNKKGNTVIEGLTAGTTYTIKVEAVDSSSGSSEHTRDITVGEPVQEWYVDCFGSATSGYAVVDGEETRIQSYSELYPVSTHLVKDITDGKGEVVFDLRGNENGKIADSEEGIMVYYTRIDPSTENFKLTATFELINEEIMGNQAGFGVYAIDIAGLGTKDAKYLNSVAAGNFKLRDGEVTKYHHSGVRVVTGYESYDPTSTAGNGRVLDNTRVFSKRPAEDKIRTGEQYTYTLEKTDEGFKATYEGETFEIQGVDKLMVQEDGSMIAAVAVGRCNAKVTNIHFEKTEGSAGGGGEVEKIVPEVHIYSSQTTGVPEYQFIANANVRGEFTVLNGETEIGKAEAGPELVAKIDVQLWNEGGQNEISYKFVPDQNEPDLANYDTIAGKMMVSWAAEQVKKDVVYTSPEAKKDGAGTRKDPRDLQTLLDNAYPGQKIIMLDGTYAPAQQYLIPRNVSGEEGNEIVLMPENTGKVKITGENMNSASLFHIVGDYWHVYGIEFCDGKNKAVSVSGNHNTVEMCTMHDVGNSGVQISRYSGEPNVQEMWPSYNLIKNCEAYNCCDPARNDADGFAAKLTCGEGNVFYGCISHHNIDDGWDLYAKSTTGPIGAVRIENCIAYSNGFLLGDDPTDPTVAFGEGNGFKLGGENMYGAHKLINSVSFNNYAKGITSNSGPDCQVINCTAYNNSLKGGSYNLSLYTKASNEKAWVVSGTISIATNGKTAAELGSANGILYSLRSATNYLFDGKQSLNTKSVEATEDWFENVDVTNVPTRNEDGTINMHGLLVLKDSAPKDSGARINTSEEAASKKPEYDVNSAVRLDGKDDVAKGLKYADELKELRGIEKFDAVVVASAEKFADALAGSYLAAKKNAPILVVDEAHEADVSRYVLENLSENGTVYILGGDAAVAKSFEESLGSVKVNRLAGETRYETNFAILEEAGVENETILIASGGNYPDSLSAAAAQLPILLVNFKKGLSDEQKIYLARKEQNEICILGGTSAVSEDTEKFIEKLGNKYERLGGADRYATSLLVAEKFAPEAGKAVLAISNQFTDGLCGSMLAVQLKAPLILTKTGKEDVAAKYCADRKIGNGYVLGGEDLISDEAVQKIFGVDEVIVKE